LVFVTTARVGGSLEPSGDPLSLPGSTGKTLDQTAN
jgi:hypothetical protein